MLRVLQVLQLVFTQVTQGDTLGQVFADQLLSGCADQGLPAVGYGAQSGAAVYRAPIIIALSQVGLSGMEGNAYSQRCVRRPRLTVKRLLHGGSSKQRICSP
jgi:hypothetical protein